MGYGRKITGGKYKMYSKKKKYDLPGINRKVKLGKTKQKTIRGMGGNKRSVLLSEEYANVLNPETKKSKNPR
jgi:small subunit ribosomal protein S8e